MGFNNLQTSQIIKISVVGGQIFIVAIMVVYMIFAFVLTRRVKIMNLNLKTPHGKSFSALAKIHFIVSLFVVILTLLSIRI